MSDDDEADEREFLAFQQRSAGAPAPDKVKTRTRKTADRFAMVPIWWVEQAAKATNTPRALMLVWLLDLAWETKSNTFSLTNVKLRGVHRNTERVHPWGPRRTPLFRARADRRGAHRAATHPSRTP